MGFNIKDITAFMISPVVNIINDISSGNMFDEYLFDMNVNTATKILEGRFPIYKFFYGKYGNKNGNKAAFDLVHSGLQKALQEAGFVKEKKIKDKDGKEKVVEEPKTYNNIYSITRDYYKARLLGLITEPITSFISDIEKPTRINNNFIAFSNFIESIIYKAKNAIYEYGDIEQFEADIKEFKHIYELATETSTLGNTFLGLNQGIPTSKKDLLNKVLNIQRAMSDREEVFKITKNNLEDQETKDVIVSNILNNNSFLSKEEVENILAEAVQSNLINNFNFYTWLEDPKYRRIVSRYYNIIKGTWNIFDVIEKLPHFKAIFDAFKTIISTDNLLIKKSYLLNKICKDLYKNGDYVKPEDINRLIDYVDDLLTLRWLKNKNIEIEVFEGVEVFKYDWGVEKHQGKPTSLAIDDITSIGTFKKFFEEVLFPALKTDSYKDVKDGVVVEKQVPEDNRFIKNLVLDIDKDGQYFLKLNVNMQNVNSTVYNSTKYQESLSDFVKLSNYTMFGRSLTDWFMLYNLLVNKNKYGVDRFTTLFNAFVDTVKQPSLIKEYLKDVGNFDFSIAESKGLEDLYEYGYNRDDALLRIAPIVSPSQEINSNAELIKQTASNGTTIVKRKGSNGYSGRSELIPTTSDTNSEDFLNRYQNSIRYGLFSLPFANALSSTKTNIKSNDPNLVYDALYTYIKKGLITIELKNC